MNNIEQPSPIQEQQQTPERVQALDHFTALHTRLLLTGDALNPEKTDIPPIRPDPLKNLGERDYKVFNNASNYDRAVFWRGKEGNDFERQKTQWLEDTVTTFQSSRDFFIQHPRGKQWSEMFAKMRIDTNNFTKENAEELYNRYFRGDTKDSSIKTFVAEVIGAYTSGGVLDVQKLIQNLGAIHWLANIFGERSSEVAQHLVIAEVQLQERSMKQGLIDSSNTQQERNGKQQSRVNTLNDDEKRILSFVWRYHQEQQAHKRSHPTEPGQRPQDRPIRDANSPDGYKWRGSQERGSNPREFPGTELVAYLNNPTTIAEGLKRMHPERYRNKSIAALAQEVLAEHIQLEAIFKRYGLTYEHMGSIALKSIQHYEQFVKNQFGANVPDIQNLTIYPISGMTSEFYQASEGTLGFVYANFPAIFLNMESIAQAAQNIGLQTRSNWREMTPQELTQAIERLLNEIHPHEYSHLTAEIGFWRQYKKTGNQEEKTNAIMERRGGLRMIKPKYPHKTDEDPLFNNFTMRGGGLNEAITVELTNQWARSFNARLDINAYPEERQVLASLTQLLSQEQGISKDEAFKKFAKAYFDRKSLLTLAKSFPPFMLSIVFALMEYEIEKSKNKHTQAAYPLTIAYVQDSLSTTQRAELRQRSNDIKHLSKPAKRALQKKLTAQPYTQAA